MNMKLFVFLFALELAGFVVLGQHRPDQVAIIRSLRLQSNAAIARHDADGIAAFWMPDFVQVRGNGTCEFGKKTIKASWDELFRNNSEVLYVRNPVEVVISVNDSLAWERGFWTAKNSYSNGGNYSAMWKKVGPDWKIQAEIFVSLH